MQRNAPQFFCHASEPCDYPVTASLPPGSASFPMVAGSESEALVHDLMVELESLRSQQRRTDDALWTLVSSTLLFLMQLGFAMVESGMCRQVNVISTYAKNILDFACGSLVAFAYSYHLAYGVDSFHLQSEGASQIVHWFNYCVVQATAATIISGAMAERTSVVGYIILSVYASALVIPLAVKAVWGGGFLANLEPPFHDFAGSGVVHVVGGTMATCGAAVIGSRIGRWDPKNQADFAPHDVKSMLGGVLILWVGWYGFNGGSAHNFSSDRGLMQASNAYLNTTLSGAAGGVAAVALSRGMSLWSAWKKGILGDHTEVDVQHLTNGILSGLVAITAGCDVVSGWAALTIGTISGLAYPQFSHLFGPVMHIDDVRSPPPRSSQSQHTT